MQTEFQMHGIGDQLAMRRAAFRAVASWLDQSPRDQPQHLVSSHEDNLSSTKAPAQIFLPHASCVVFHSLGFPRDLPLAQAFKLHFLIRSLIKMPHLPDIIRQGVMKSIFALLQVSLTDTQAVLSRQLSIATIQLRVQNRPIAFAESSEGMCPLYYRFIWPVCPLGLQRKEVECLHILSRWHSRSLEAHSLSEEEFAPPNVQLAWCLLMHWSCYAAHSQMLPVLPLLGQPMLISLRDNAKVFLRRYEFLPLKCLPLLIYRPSMSILSKEPVRQVRKRLPHVNCQIILHRRIM
jgi:hypothetical protein